MVGPLAQAIALVTYGNDFLIKKNFPNDFASLNSTFQFCNKVNFQMKRQPFLSSKPKDTVVACNPEEWFRYLKADKCKNLCLRYLSSKNPKFGKDYKLAGMVGGGGRWLIEAIYDNYSNYWEGFWNVTNQNAPDRKIWAVMYGLQFKHKSAGFPQPNRQAVKDKLRNTLTEIADFASKQNLSYWAEQFDKASAALDTDTPEENYYHKDLVPPNNYLLTAKQLLFSAGLAWVFGGMGWWNDVGSFENKSDTDTYERLSEQLYSNINEAIMAGANIY